MKWNGWFHQIRLSKRWAVAHNETFSCSKERLGKVQPIFDHLYQEITGIPLVTQYIQGFRDYLDKKNAEEITSQNRNAERTRGQIEEWKREFRDKPDPFNEVVKLFEALHK